MLYNSNDLRDKIMEGIDEREIERKGLSWCIEKYKMIMGLLLAGQFTEDVRNTSDVTTFLVALEERIKLLHGTVPSMASIRDALQVPIII